MAGALALLVDDEQQRVAVAVVVGLPHVLPVARRLALAPVLLAAARPEPRPPRLQRLVEGGIVHVGEHENVARPRFLDDGGDEAVGVVLDAGQVLGVRRILEVQDGVSAHLRQRRRLRGDDDLSSRQRLQDGKAEPFVEARHDHRRGAPVQQLEQGLVDQAQHTAVPGGTKPRGQIGIAYRPGDDQREAVEALYRGQRRRLVLARLDPADLEDETSVDPELTQSRGRRGGH